MTDLEAARHISQAILNLPEQYPYKEEANEAFGKLILGRLNLVEPCTIVINESTGFISLEPKS